MQEIIQGAGNVFYYLEPSDNCMGIHMHKISYGLYFSESLKLTNSIRRFTPKTNAVGLEGLEVKGKLISDADGPKETGIGTLLDTVSSDSKRDDVRALVS